jgi:hypothetical protein
MQVIGHTLDAETAAITDPQWQEIGALVRIVATATPEQVEQFATARATAAGACGGSAADGGAIDAAGIAMCAAWREARNVDAAWAAAADATRPFGGVWSVEWKAAWEAALALVVRDLIGRYGFEQQHYDLLAGPWRAVFGPLHPDDDAF